MRILILCLITATLAACQPRQQPVGCPQQEAQIHDSTFAPSDAARLPLKRWLPQGRVRAVVLALHGFNDYSNAFALPAPELAKHGIATYAYDQRGFGGTDQRGIWGNRDNLTQDLREALVALKARYPHVPVYLLGESMGGAVAVAACTSGATCPEAAGLILVAPALWGGEAMSDWHRLLLWLTVHTLPGMKLTGEGLKIQASDNIEVLRAMGRDPLIIKATRVDAIYGLVQLMDEGHAATAKLATPTLLLYGKRDQVIPPEAFTTASERIKAPLRTAAYPEGWHLLLRDLSRAQPIRDIAHWALHKNGPLPSGHEIPAPLMHRQTPAPHSGD